MKTLAWLSSDAHPVECAPPPLLHVVVRTLVNGMLRSLVKGFVSVPHLAERNPDFEKVVAEKVPDKEQVVIVACDIGGTLDTLIRVGEKKPVADKDRAFGRESRSMKAAY